MGGGTADLRVPCFVPEREMMRSAQSEFFSCLSKVELCSGLLVLWAVELFGLSANAQGLRLF